MRGPSPHLSVDQVCIFAWTKSNFRCGSVNHATSAKLYRSYYPHTRELVSPVCGILNLNLTFPYAFVFCVLCFCVFDTRPKNKNMERVLLLQKGLFTHDDILFRGVPRALLSLCHAHSFFHPAPHLLFCHL